VPFVGYRVRTLHGLAHDVVRERPALVGLADDFVILDEKLSLDIQRDIVLQHLPEWWDRLSGYFDPEVNPQSARRASEHDLPDLVTRFIKHAKDLRRGPDDLSAMLSGADSGFDLVRFAAYVYNDYQRSLAYRGAVDFDDLVRLALDALERDERYLLRLRKQWPFVLEDEAQDSSHLQEEMLRLLSDGKNWVRVGDPNQAINTTFTTADPAFLLRFLDERRVTERPLSVSGRSTPSIVMLANELVRWAVEEHPSLDLRDAFDYRVDARRGVLRGHIRSAPKGDPQPSPDDGESYIVIRYRLDQKITPDKELEMVVSGDEFSLLEWLASIPEDERSTVAVLVPENSRGFKLAEMLRRQGIRYEELLRSTTETRQTVALLQTLLEYLSDPTDLRRLKQMYWSLMPDDRREQVKGDVDLRAAISDVFKRWQNLEDFLWPVLADSVTELRETAGDYAWLTDDLQAFRQQVRRWLVATSLPVDQLVLTIAQDIFTEAVDVALAHKVAVMLHGVAESHADWRLPEFVEELRVISGNERRFIGFDDAEAGYEPKPGIVTVATMHAAKGLEWDRVYLMAVSNYGFPSALPYDLYIGEKWYARASADLRVGHLNLEAETLAQLDVLENRTSYVEGEATLQARVDYARERLRLLYVGITRARRELIVTWNMGRYWQKGRESENQPALPVVVLGEFVGREL
jgi:DNA helicase-2/ATP-dependent DNA helicase PcrA